MIAFLFEVFFQVLPSKFHVKTIRIDFNHLIFIWIAEGGEGNVFSWQYSFFWRNGG